MDRRLTGCRHAVGIGRASIGHRPVLWIDHGSNGGVDHGHHRKAAHGGFGTVAVQRPRLDVVSGHCQTGQRQRPCAVGVGRRFTLGCGAVENFHLKIGGGGTGQRELGVDRKAVGRNFPIGIPDAADGGRDGCGNDERPDLRYRACSVQRFGLERVRRHAEV